MKYVFSKTWSLFFVFFIFLGVEKWLFCGYMKAGLDGFLPEDSSTPEARSFPAGGVIARCGWDARKPLVIMHLGGATKTMEG